jgi:hypothetical protein
VTITGHQREVDRNRLLRRVDWRFLLADPEPGRIGCFCKGMLAEAILQLDTRVVGSGNGVGSDCDLVVLVDPDPKELTAAWMALRQGGLCYVEWHSALPGHGAEEARRALDLADFTETTCYLPIPGPARAPASLWIPLGVPGATYYLRRNGPRPHGLLPRMRRLAGRLLYRVQPRARGCVPICAVARKPNVPGTILSGHSTVQGQLIDLIRERWGEWGLGIPPQGLSALLLTGGEHSLNKIVALIFAGSERRPRLALNYPRTPDALPGVLREAKNLKTLQATSQVQGVPRFVSLEQGSRAAVLAETALTGTSFDNLVTPQRYRSLAQRGTDWLVELAGKSSPVTRSGWESRLIDPVVAEFEAAYGPVLRPGLLEQARRRLQQIGPLPLVWEQRDFAPWNLLDLGRGKLGVLDWESAEPMGLPAMDLIYYLTYLCLYLDNAKGPEESRNSYRRSLDPRSTTGGVTQEMVGRYTSRLGMDPATVRLLRPLVWMIHSRSEYRRMAADVGGPPEAAQLRGSVCLALLEEDLDDDRA